MTNLQAILLTLGFLLLVFVVARLLGDGLRWWAMITKEEGDLE